MVRNSYSYFELKAALLLLPWILGAWMGARLLFPEGFRNRFLPPPPSVPAAVTLPAPERIAPTPVVVAPPPPIPEKMLPPPVAKQPIELTFPYDGEEITEADSRPLSLEWRGPKVAYWVEISSTEDFRKAQRILGPAKRFSISNEALRLPPGTYFWRVRSAKQTSRPRSFTLLPQAILPPPSSKVKVRKKE